MLFHIYLNFIKQISPDIFPIFMIIIRQIKIEKQNHFKIFKKMLNHTTLKNKSLYEEEEILENIRKVNIFAISLIVFMGLVGHLLTICVYSQKKFRQNSNTVYLLVLAINDSLFLIVHFFEDTARTIKDVYSTEFLSLVDSCHWACYLFSYLRNVIRFNSAYIIVAFTLQRLLLVYKPLSGQMKSKQSAWSLICFICLVGSVSNSWTFFFFRLNEKNFCDVFEGLHFEYLILNSIYVFLVFVIPIVFLIICNCLVISKSRADDINRRKLDQTTMIETNQMTVIISNPTTYKQKTSKKNRYLTVMKRKQTFYSKKITKTLVIISVAYVFLNLPYMVSWFIYFFNVETSNETFKNYQFAALQISEIFYVSNYAIAFFAYCLSGTKFRQQLLSFTLSPVSKYK